jgi:ribosomal protein S18 acetylase RimI-like enzyme
VKLNIQAAKIEEAVVLSELSQKIFWETFGAFNKAEDMEAYIKVAYTPDKLSQEIADPTRRIYIAWDEETPGLPIGYSHLHLGPAEDCIQGPNPIRLLRFYIDSAYHGKGVAQKLMETTTACCLQMGFKTLWLGVWGENLRAQKFYAKLGFKKVGEEKFLLGTDLQFDDLLEAPLPLHLNVNV